jgi:hypothetical protein
MPQEARFEGELQTLSSQGYKENLLEMDEVFRTIDCP